VGDPAIGLVVDKDGHALYGVDIPIPMAGPVVVAAYSRSGVVCLGTEAGELAVWQLAEGVKPIGQRDLGVPVMCVAMSATAQTLAVACDDGTIRILAGPDLSDVASLPSAGFIRDVDVSGDRLVAVLSYDNRIRVWDLVSEELVCESGPGADVSPPLVIDAEGDYVILGDFADGDRVSRLPLSARALGEWARQAAGRELSADERRRYLGETPT
jgi:hypothetical protein